jgi:hypothetical protein
MFTLKSRYALFAVLTFITTPIVTAKETGNKIDANTFKCETLNKTKTEYIPQTLYWVHGHISNGQIVLEPGMDYVQVPIEEYITECKANPQKAVKEVILEHAKKKQAK